MTEVHVRLCVGLGTGRGNIRSFGEDPLVLEVPVGVKVALVPSELFYFILGAQLLDEFEPGVGESGNQKVFTRPMVPDGFSPGVWFGSRFCG